jgi:drug/metabolite transporter (DMT)-like permease
VLAIGPTIAGFGLYTVSLRYLQASVAGLIATLEPVLTAIMAVVLLGERLDEKQLLGAALILLAVILVQGESATSETSTVVVREA